MATLSSRLTPLTVSVPAASGWTSYTPTGAITTNCTYAGKWRRIGENIELQISMLFSGANTQGALNFTEAQILNGLGLTVDTSKLAVGGADYATAIGTWNSLDSGVSAAFSGLVERRQSGTIELVYPSGNTSAQAVNTATPLPFTISNGDTFSIRVTLPITGWTSHTASATSANAVVVGGQSVGSKLNIGATSAQGVALLANNAAIVDSNSTGLIALKFAPTNTTSSDVNTLDDYEEGTFTPTLNFAGGTTGILYASQRYGNYTKIGNRVYFNIYFVLSNKGTDVGSAYVSGLPFTPVAIASGGVSTCTIWGGFLSRTNYMLVAYVDAPNARVAIEGTAINADAAASVGITNAHFANNSSVMLSGHYITAS